MTNAVVRQAKDERKEQLRSKRDNWYKFSIEKRTKLESFKKESVISTKTNLSSRKLKQMHRLSKAEEVVCLHVGKIKTGTEGSLVFATQEEADEYILSNTSNVAPTQTKILVDWENDVIADGTVNRLFRRIRQ